MTPVQPHPGPPACEEVTIQPLPQIPVEAFNEAVMHSRAGRHAEAEAAFRAIAEAHPDIAVVRSNLGISLAALGRREEAVQEILRAVNLKPDFHDAFHALGTVLLEMGRVDDASRVYEALRDRRPDYPMLSLILGNIRMFQDRPDAAAALLRLAVIDDPGNGVARNNLGAAILSQGDMLEGARHYRRAIAISPACAEWRKNLGACLLMAGEFEEGARAYEGRLDQGVWDKRVFDAPRWTGGPLDGRTILVHHEQGLGDSFQFIRYMPILKRMGARVVYECQPVLKRVLSVADGVDVLVAKGEPLPPFDCYVSLMSLIHLLGTTPRNVPATVPYLFPEPERVAAWRRRMGDGEFRIGISWHAKDVGRSIPLEHFLPLSRIPGVRLYGLQKLVGLDQLERLRDQLGVVDWSAEMDAGPDAFVDTAAVMANMDLIVGCDTAVNHLSGALGRPTWLVLKWFGDWRWMRDREDSPWYPTMRLFRQRIKHDWAEAMDRVAAEAAALVAARRAAD